MSEKMLCRAVEKSQDIDSKKVRYRNLIRFQNNRKEYYENVATKVKTQNDSRAQQFKLAYLDLKDQLAKKDK